MRSVYRYIIIVVAVVIVVTASTLTVTLLQYGNATRDDRVRIGFFANVTHAPVLIAKANSIFEDELRGYKVEYKVFNAGPDAILALLTGNIDFAYVGPVPALNAYIASKGSTKIIAGVAANGAMLVVRDDINSIYDMNGKVIGSPQYANTQDVALKSYLADNGIDAKVINAKNRELLLLLANGYIDGAWVPEPWATRMLRYGKVLVDERSLWSDGIFATTVLVTTDDVIDDKREVVDGVLRAHIRSIKLMESDDEYTTIIEEIAELTGQRLDSDIVKNSLKNMRFTYEHMQESIQGYYEKGRRLGLITSNINIHDIFYTEPLENLKGIRNNDKIKQ